MAEHWLARMTNGPLPEDLPKWLSIIDQICRNSHWYAYWRLINLARKRKRPNKIKCKNFHRHHILPKCVNGSGTEIVWLKHLEHFKAHLLLVKMCHNNKFLDKMLNALGVMTRGEKFQCSEKTFKILCKITRMASIAAQLSYWENPKYRKKMIKNLGYKGSKARWSRVGAHERKSLISKGMWQCPEYRKKIIMIKKFISLETRKKNRKAAQARWSRPGEHEKQSYALIIANKNNPEINKKRSLATKIRFQCPKEREKQSAIMKKICQCPKERKRRSIRMKEICKRPEVKIQREITMKRIWQQRREGILPMPKIK